MYHNTMRNVALAAAVGLTLVPFAARAADMPIKAPRYAPPPMWTGWYVGLNAGYGFGSNDVAISAPGVVPGLVPASLSVDSSGFIFGAQVGYNYQWAASWVVGAEADFDYSAIKGDNSVTNVGALGGPVVTTSVEHKMDWFGTARLRAGYLLFDPLLIYATGGLAVGEVKDTATIVAPGVAFSGSQNAMKLGWTIGAGAEWAFLASWSAKAEYLYYDLGSNSVDIPLLPGTTASFPAKGHLVRLGANYRF